MVIPRDWDLPLPYSWAKGLTRDDRQLVREAMDYIESVSCVR